MTTVSQLVDRVAREVVRPDALTLLPGYLNQTIRELHTHAQSNMPVFYDDNRQEDRIQVSVVDDLTGAFVWTMPRPTLLQNIESVYYESIGKYARKGNPKTSMQRSIFNIDSAYFWYRVGNSIAFAKTGGVGAFIRVSWHEYPRAVAYQSFKDSNRIEFKESLGRYVLVNQDDATPTAEQLATVTNWVIQRHEEMLAEGMRAKMYKRMGDDGRARTHYSQYETSRLGVQNNESINFDVVQEG